MTDDEDVVAADLPAHLGLCAEVVEQARVASDAVSLLGARLDGEASAAADRAGMSFLQLKNAVMLDYLSNLCYVALRKASGASLRDDAAAVERLVTDRTVLEKMRPLEQKLKYQIDKAVKVAESGRVAANDPIHFKANPKDMISRLGDDDDDDDDEDDDEDDEDNPKSGGASSGKYVAPRNVPAYFDEGGAASREEAEEASSLGQKKRMLSKSLIEDLRRQHLDTPEEVHEHDTAMRRKQADAAKERTRYEEDNFIRLPMGKRERHSGRLGRLSTVGSIGDEVTAFGRNFFSDERKKGGSSSGGKKRKSFGKSKKGGGGGGGFAKKKKFKH